MTTPTTTTEERAIPRMTYCPEDFFSFNALAAVPEFYRPQLDHTTRQILKALLYDLRGHSETTTDPETDPDAWLSIQIPINVLYQLLDDIDPPCAERAAV